MTLTNKLILDSIGAVLSVLAIESLYYFSIVSGDVDYPSMGFDIAIGILSYLLALVILYYSHRDFTSLGTLRTIIAVITGSSTFMLLKMMGAIYSDVDFLALNPDMIYKRHIVTGIKISFLLIPVLSICTILWILAIRFVGRMIFLSRDIS